MVEGKFCFKSKDRLWLVDLQVGWIPVFSTLWIIKFIQVTIEEAHQGKLWILVVLQRLNTQPVPS